MPGFLTRRRCERLRRVILILFLRCRRVFTDHSCLFSEGARLCSERLFSKNTPQAEVRSTRSETLSLLHLLTVALLRTDRFFEMTSDSILRLKFKSHTVEQLWSGGGLSLFNHRPEGHSYSLLLPRQYVFAFDGGGRGKKKKTI